MAEKVKKIEIVIDYLQLKNLLTKLEDAGFDNYTAIKDVIGKGSRGSRSGDGLTGEFNNSLVIIACKDNEVDKITKIVNPLLKKFGGVLLVSEAKLIEH